MVCHLSCHASICSAVTPSAGMGLVPLYSGVSLQEWHSLELGPSPKQESSSRQAKSFSQVLFHLQQTCSCHTSTNVTVAQMRITCADAILTSSVDRARILRVQASQKGQQSLTNTHWQTVAAFEGFSRRVFSFWRRCTTGIPTSTASITAVDEFTPPADPASDTSFPKTLLWYTPRCSAILAPNDLQAARISLPRRHRRSWPDIGHEPTAMEDSCHPLIQHLTQTSQRQAVVHIQVQCFYGARGPARAPMSPNMQAQEAMSTPTAVQGLRSFHMSDL